MLLSQCDKTGMTTHTLDLTKALVKKNISVTVLIGYNKHTATDIEKKLYERFVETGAIIKTFIKPKGSKIKLLKGAITLLYNLTSVNHYDLVHVQSPYLSWAPWLLRKKFVSTMHVTDIYPSPFYKKATHLIAISRETKEFAKNIHNYSEDDITIVHHGVDSRFSIVMSNKEKALKRNELGLPDDKVIICIVGSIEPRKGHDILLKAISRLTPCVKEKIHVVIVGSNKNSDNGNDRWLKKTLIETKTESFVSQFEYQDPEIFYKISDLFTLPSWQEGFPVVVIEAMLSDCLCIRSNAEGAYEQIKDGETGYIFPKGDIDKLADILNKVIINEENRHKLAKMGREYALDHFLSDTMAENTIKVYEKTITKRH